MRDAEGVLLAGFGLGQHLRSGFERTVEVVDAGHVQLHVAQRHQHAGHHRTATLACAQEAVGRIEARVSKLQSAQRPAPLPAQCAPGKQRMDAVNAGADP